MQWQEFWVCHEDGQMMFFDANGQLTKSNLVPAFPSRVKVVA